MLRSYLFFGFMLAFISGIGVLYPELSWGLGYLLALPVLQLALWRPWWEALVGAGLTSMLGYYLTPAGVEFLLQVVFYFSIVILIAVYRRALTNRGPLVPTSEEDIANMFYAMDLLEREMKNIRQHGGTLTVAIVDLDNFKRVNEDLGHVQGDLLLRLFGRVLMRNLRPSDIATRYAGDEFLIIFPNTVGEKAQELLDEIRMRIQEHAQVFKLEGIEDPFSFCAGIVEYSPNYETVRDFFRAVDEALYQAKKLGKGASIIVKQDKSISFRNRRYWERVVIKDETIRAILYDTRGNAYKVRPANMCLVGMMFVSPIRVDEGTVYDLELSFKNGDRVIVPAKAVWHRRLEDGLYQVGVFLSNLSPQQKFFLHKKIEEIKASLS